MQIPEILYFCIRGLALLIEGAFALLLAGLRCIATAVMRREQLPCDLVVTTKSGRSFSGVLLADPMPSPGDWVGGPASAPSSVDTSPSLGAACDCPPCTAAKWGDASAGFVHDDEQDDDSWGH